MADLTLREALDHVRAYQTKFVKPLEKLGEVLETARDLEQSVERLRREAGELEQQMNAQRALIPSISLAAEKARATIVEWQQKVEVAQGRAQAAITEAQQQTRDADGRSQRIVEELQAVTAAQEATLREGFAQPKRDLEREITALTEKKAGLDQAIAALRAKF